MKHIFITVLVASVVGYLAASFVLSSSGLVTL